jgi:hypothetical protein
MCHKRIHLMVTVKIGAAASFGLGVILHSLGSANALIDWRCWTR